MKRWLRLLFLSITLMLGVLCILEIPPRVALWKAGFSHLTYRSGGLSLLRTSIASSDRKPSLKGWIDHFPRLNRLSLTAGGNNRNFFQSLVPFTQIEGLRNLTLTGVHLNSVDEIPSFPLLEILWLDQSNCWNGGIPPSTKQLNELRLRLPKLKTLRIHDNDYLRTLQFDVQRNVMSYTEEEP